MNIIIERIDLNLIHILILVGAMISTIGAMHPHAVNVPILRHPHVTSSTHPHHIVGVY